jgi:prophage tail gpP-like protein
MLNSAGDAKKFKQERPFTPAKRFVGDLESPMPGALAASIIKIGPIGRRRTFILENARAMALERITMIAGGVEYSGWKRVEVRAGLAQAARSFEVATTEIVGAFQSPFDVWHFPPFTGIAVATKRESSSQPGETLCAGFVDDYLPAAGAEEHSVTITGRGKGGIIVDSAPDHETGAFEDRTVLQILQELAAPYGIEVKADAVAILAASQVVPLFQLRRGESTWAEMTRLVGDYAVVLSGQADGSIAITRAGTGRHAGAIAQGDMAGAIKIKEMNARLSAGGRFSEYRVIYQNAIGVEDENLEGEATAKDEGVPFHKVREVIAATEMDQHRAQSLATWMAVRAAGEGTQATVTVPGFRDVAGTLWMPGNLVFVFSPFLKLEADMVVVEAVFSQDDQRGTITTLTVADPRSFYGESPSQSGSGDVWKFGVPKFWGVF